MVLYSDISLPSLISCAPMSFTQKAYSDYLIPLIHNWRDQSQGRFGDRPVSLEQ